MTDDLRARYEHCAEKLTGRRVLLRFREPPTRGARGEAYRPQDAPSVVLIDIHPAMVGRERLEVLLHESAHAALHVRQVKPTPAHLEESGAAQAITNHSALVMAITNRREAEADHLAHKWLSWAERQTEKHVKPGDDWPVQEAMILAALDFYHEVNHE